MQTYKILISIASAAVCALSAGLSGQCDEPGEKPKNLSNASEANKTNKSSNTNNVDSKEIVSEQFFKFRTFPVAFTTRKISKGHTFTAADLQDREVSLEHVPADAVVTSKKLYGKKSVATINEHNVVSVQDIGLRLKENEIVGTNVRDWKYNREKMRSIAVAKVELKAGETIQREHVVNTMMPLRLVPCDAVTNSGQIIGKKCKFGCAQNHILMQHDIL